VNSMWTGGGLEGMRATQVQAVKRGRGVLGGGTVALRLCKRRECGKGGWGGEERILSRKCGKESVTGRRSPHTRKIVFSRGLIKKGEKQR